MLIFSRLASTWVGHSDSTVASSNGRLLSISTISRIDKFLQGKVDSYTSIRNFVHSVVTTLVTFTFAPSESLFFPNSLALVTSPITFVFVVASDFVMLPSFSWFTTLIYATTIATIILVFSKSFVIAAASTIVVTTISISAIDPSMLFFLTNEMEISSTLTLKGCHILTCNKCNIFRWYSVFLH